MNHAPLAVGRQPHQGREGGQKASWTYLDGREETLPKGMEDATTLGQAEGLGVFAEEVGEPGCGPLEVLLGGFHSPEFQLGHVQEGPYLALQAQTLQVPLSSQETLLQALQFRRHLLAIDPARAQQLRPCPQAGGSRVGRVVLPTSSALQDGADPASPSPPPRVSSIAFLTERQGPRAGAYGENAEGWGPSSQPPGEETKGAPKVSPVARPPSPASTQAPSLAQKDFL